MKDGTASKLRTAFGQSFVPLLKLFPQTPPRFLPKNLPILNRVLYVKVGLCFHFNPTYLQSLMRLHCNKSSGFLNPYDQSSAPNPILLISGQALCMLHV